MYVYTYAYSHKTIYIWTQTCLLETYLFMIDGHFQRNLHLPRQVAYNCINCQDTKLSKYQNSWTQVY